MLLRLLVAFLLFIPAAANARAAPLDRILVSLAEQGRFDGAVAIMRGNRLLYARGFGLADAERRLPFRPDTAVDTGSIAKPITAAAVLLLVQERRIDLARPARAYVREYPNSTTTVRQLLAHRGGLPDYDSFEEALSSGRVVRTTDLLGLFAARGAATAFAPGSRFAYCNLCFDTLALIVERVTAEPFESFVRRRLLAPAGASRAFLRPARFADWNGVRMRGYRRTAAGTEPNDALDNEGFYGGSNIYFSALDLARWAAAWANRGRAVRRVARLATAPVAFGDGRSGLTLGNWYCSGRRTQCYYRGHHQGFHAFSYWDSRRRIAVAFVSNGTISPALHVALPRALIATAEGRPPVLEEEPAGQSAALEPGRHSVERIGTILISRDASGLRLQRPGRTSHQLFPIGSGWFYAPGLDAYLKRPAGSRDLVWRSVFSR